MIRRDARPDDDHFGKVNGLGGKVDPDEGVVESLRRELREEASVELESIELRGTITWALVGFMMDFDYWPSIGGWTGTFLARFGF